MSTLPRLPAKYRGYSNNTGFPLPNAIRANKISYFQTAPQNVTQTSPKSTTFSPKSSDNYQLQSIRDAALKKYEIYNWQLRQLERNFQLDVKRIEQQGTRDLSRVMDSISALKSEMAQLNNQTSVLQTKLNNLKSKQLDTEKSGVQTLIDPLKNSFDAFGKEFDGALKNINILFANLSSRVQIVNRSFGAQKSSNSDALNVSDSLQQLEANLQNNSISLLSIHKELESMINRQKSNVETRIQNRISTFHDRIDALEQLSFQSLHKYQTISGDAQISQYEMRDLFDNSVNTVSSSFKSKLEEAKRSIFELQQSRFDQIDAINARVSKTRESIAKMRKKKLKSMINNQSSTSPLSHQSQIEFLTNKVSELEQKLQEKLKARMIQKESQQNDKSINPLMNQFENLEQKLNENIEQENESANEQKIDNQENKENADDTEQQLNQNENESETTEQKLENDENQENKENADDTEQQLNQNENESETTEQKLENDENQLNDNEIEENANKNDDTPAKIQKEIPEIRVYYNIDDNENVKIIFVDKNGYVVYN